MARKGYKQTEVHKRKISESRLKRKKVLGFLNSKETRKKISVANKGRKGWNKGLKKETNESVRRISEAKKGKNNPNYGKHLSEEVKRKLRIAMRGNQYGFGSKRSNEQKIKMSEIISGKNHPMYGKHLSEETKRKISIGNKGKYHSEEAKRKIGEAQKGKKLSVETRRKMSIRMKEAMKDPERIHQSLKNSFGNTCCYNNEFFPSLQERDCYIKLRKLGFKVKHNFEGRFDFLVIKNNKKVVVEFHSYDRNGLTNKQYYNQRRKLLNEYEYKDLKLIVIKDLKEIENKLNNVLGGS